MEELRSYWQVPSIAHFCHLFRNSFKLPKFDIEELEFAFLSKLNDPKQDNTLNGYNDSDYDDNLLKKIIIILLRGYFNHHPISKANWEQYLVKLFDILWVGVEKKKSPFFRTEHRDNKSEKVKVSFDDLPLFVKVDVVYHLCEYRLYPEDGQNAANLIESNELRLKPVGEDSKGYFYWYFLGNRLYRENRKVAKAIQSKLSDFDDWQKKINKAKANLDEKLSEKKKGRRKVAERSCRSKEKQTKKSSSNDNFFDETTSCGIPLVELKEAWCVICYSFEEWKSLQLKLSQSTENCELVFSKVLADNFLKKIGDYFVIKEKEAKKRLLELLPRRGSSRLEAKKLQKEQEEKRAQEELESRKRKRAEAEERAKMEEERLKQERVKIDRERRAKQRLAIIESTANRIQENNEISNENETDAFQSSESNSSDMYNNNTQDDETYESLATSNGWPVIDFNNSQFTTEELDEGLPKVIAAVMSNRDAWPFKEAVDEKSVPLYYRVIEEPIDLSIIENKINQRLYSDLNELERDFKLLVNNCETYNGPRNGYTLMAYATWKAFKKAVHKYLNRNLKEDERTVFIYPPKVTNNNPKAAIEARKRRKRKQRKGMKALEILAKAAQIAVKDTSSRSSSVCVSDDQMISDVDEEKEPLSAFKQHGSTLARYVYTQNTQTVSGVCSSMPDSNLTFKSLSEWSESLKKSGNSIILPQNTVVVTTSPMTSSWLTNGSLTAAAPASSKTSDETMQSLIERSDTQTTCQTASIPVTNNQRLVIKLSKCNDGGSTCWQLSNRNLDNVDQECAQQTTVLSALNEQSSINLINGNHSSSSVKHLSNSCIPMKKRHYVPPSDSECENNNEESFQKLNLKETCKDSDPEPMPIIKSLPNSQITQKFQITGLHTSNNSNIKVLRLKRIPNETQTLFVPSNLQTIRSENSTTTETNSFET